MHHTTRLLRQTRRTIGQNIHQHRMKQNITLEKLADITGVPLWLLDRYEIGQREIRLHELVKLSDVFGVTMESLLA